jgi:predicted transcriptional regulator
MTHTYAMKRLLEHGALTLSQLVDITGWPYSSVQAAISRLMEAGLVTAVSCGRHRNKYGLAE